MAAPDGKRHLPLAPRVETAAPEDGDRPPWHWVAIGAVGVFVFWLPLSILATRLAGDQPGPLATLAHAVALALAAAAAGFVVGRFGGQAGRREAALAGLAPVLVAGAVTASSLGRGLGAAATTLLTLAVIGALGALSALVGGALGVKQRPR